MKGIHEFIPMSETAYYILLSLTEERHGYGIMQYVSALTKDRINLGPGTLYGTLSKLEAAGLVVITGEENKRKYYKISVTGEALLQAELQRIEELYQNGREVYYHGKK